MLVGFHEEGSVFSHCSHTEPESRLSLVDAYYPSPVSVLQPPCKDDLSCSFECLETVNTDDIYGKPTGTASCNIHPASFVQVLCIYLLLPPFMDATF